MSKTQVIKKIEILQSRVMELGYILGQDKGMHCQTITRELFNLERSIENGSIKIKSKK